MSGAVDRSKGSSESVDKPLRQQPAAATPSPAQTPEEVARDLARTFYEPPSTLNRYYLERLIAAALRAAAQAERERIHAALKKECAGFAQLEMEERERDPKGTGKQFNRYFGVVHFLDDLLEDFDGWAEDHAESLSPAPEGER